MANLVIVESPTKARTLSRFLGNKYQIEASMGHIRDLPKGSLGVEVENNFQPDYVIPRDKRKKVTELKKAAQKADELWLATDPDREGEAIAWHLQYIIKEAGKGKLPPIKRVVFHEITESAIKEAFLHPREIDEKLVNAQQARRVLDRLVGYKLSPLLWKKIKRGLSAGRVQTVALRLIVEREREIGKFVPNEYWSIEAQLEHKAGASFMAALIEINGKKQEINNGEDAQSHVEFLKVADYSVDKVVKKEMRRSPLPPFTTSTLQQTAGNKLGMTAKRTMMIAQNLYEQGFITYMRTDSVNLSTQAIEASREYIKDNFGDNYLPGKPKVYTSKSKNAQEAHEAIRPTDAKLHPDKLNADGFTRDHKRLYELIWRRTIASQMNEAVFDQTAVDIKAKRNVIPAEAMPAGRQAGIQERKLASFAYKLNGSPIESGMTSKDDSYLLRANGSVLKFDGWLKLYGVVQEVKEETEGEEAADLKNQILPEGLTENQLLKLLELFPKQHFTQPPPRYTEASLIKKLEELGIGRPSTYAPILSTIQDRYYVTREERKFLPTDLGFSVADFLIKHFPEVFDYEFTASMEDRLDEVSRGEREWKDTIGDFYNPFSKKLGTVEEVAEKVALPIEEVDKDCPVCSKKLVVRIGKFGKFLACSGFPDCKHTEAIEEKIDAICPDCKGEIVVRKTKKGKTFFGCKNWPECKFASWTKPK